MFLIEYLRIDQSNFRKTQSLDRKSNKTHSIKCAFEGDGFVSIEWHKAGLTTLPARMNQSGNLLIINNLQFKDEGEYNCIVNGKYNKINGTISVHVFGKLLISLFCEWLRKLDTVFS